MSLSSRSARNSGIAAQARDQFGLPGEDPRLRTTEKFVAAERYQVRAGLQALRHQGLIDAEGPQVHQTAAAEVLVNRDTALTAERGEFAATRAVKPEFENCWDGRAAAGGCGR